MGYEGSAAKHVVTMSLHEDLVRRACGVTHVAEIETVANRFASLAGRGLGKVADRERQVASDKAVVSRPGSVAEAFRNQ